jgi:hypothetical protein
MIKKLRNHPYALKWEQEEGENGKKKKEKKIFFGEAAAFKGTVFSYNGV